MFNRASSLLYQFLNEVVLVTSLRCHSVICGFHRFIHYKDLSITVLYVVFKNTLWTFKILLHYHHRIT